MRGVKLLLRVFGWLLTPFLAWAASFLGAVGGALLAMRVRDSRTGLAVTIWVGAVVGIGVIILWLRLLRRSPQIREALAVQSDGTPDIIAEQTTEPTTPAPPEATHPTR